MIGLASDPTCLGLFQAQRVPLPFRVVGRDLGRLDRGDEHGAVDLELVQFALIRRRAGMVRRVGYNRRGQWALKLHFSTFL